jgi:hypothetical protein
VTHSIGNCIKRVVVIVASVIAFQNPVSLQNAIGEWESVGNRLGVGIQGRRLGRGSGCVVLGAALASCRTRATILNTNSTN